MIIMRNRRREESGFGVSAIPLLELEDFEGSFLQETEEIKKKLSGIRESEGECSEAKLSRIEEMISAMEERIDANRRLLRTHARSASHQGFIVKRGVLWHLCAIKF